MTNQPKEVTCLAGKVRKLVLPVYHAAPPPDAPTLKRLALPQGELAQLYNAPVGMSYIAAIELRENTSRGNHFHKVREEYVYLLSGEVLLLLEDVETKVRETLSLSAGEMAIISPGVAHTLQVRRGGQAIEFAKVQFDPADTYRYALT